MPTIQEKENEYREYIDVHRANVRKAYDKIVKKYAVKYLMPQSVEILERNIERHDEDKDIDFIFDAYRRNHFPVDDKEKQLADTDYKIAWTYHSKINPHHWQFFLDDDNKKFTTPKLETDEVKEIYKLAYLEMLADWLSFGFKQKQDQEKGKDEKVSVTGDSLEFETWYNKNKNEIMIHPDMKEWLDRIIEDIITDIRENKETIYTEARSIPFNSKERKHEDGDSYIIQTDKGFIKFLPKQMYKIVQDLSQASVGYNESEMRMMLISLLRKFKTIKAAKLMTISDYKKANGIEDNKENKNYKDLNNKNTDSMIQQNESKEIITERKKRIARYNEFDNGHVFHSWYDWTEEEAEEKAKQASIENPNDVYYVAIDDIMNPSTDIRWFRGKQYTIDNINDKDSEYTKFKNQNYEKLTESESGKTYIVQGCPGYKIIYKNEDDLKFLADSIVDAIEDYGLLEVGEIASYLEDAGRDVSNEDKNGPNYLITNGEDEYYISYFDESDMESLLDELIDLLLEYTDEDEVIESLSNNEMGLEVVSESKSYKKLKLDEELIRGIPNKYQNRVRSFYRGTDNKWTIDLKPGWQTEDGKYEIKSTSRKACLIELAKLKNVKEESMAKDGIEIDGIKGTITNSGMAESKNK